MLLNADYISLSTQKCSHLYIRIRTVPFHIDRGKVLALFDLYLKSPCFIVVLEAKFDLAPNCYRTIAAIACS